MAGEYFNVVTKSAYTCKINMLLTLFFPDKSSGIKII